MKPIRGGLLSVVGAALSLLALGLLLPVTVVVLAPDHARATFPGHNGRIAFEGSRSGPSDIYVMNADGSHKRNLTQSPGSDYSPAFSADGRKIAFERQRPHRHNSDIYVMNANGSHQRRLTHGPWNDLSPSFSPSGKRIVFTRTRNGSPQIYKMRADGSHQRRLTQNRFRDLSPSFSPDGKKIVFTSGESQIYKMDADGSHQRRLTNNTRRNNGSPDFSPDGRRIVFGASRRTDSLIKVMRAGGGHQRRLTDDPGYNYFADFSPSGKSIVFVHQGRDSDGFPVIFKMSADGSYRIRLAGARLEPASPDWGIRNPP